MAGGVYREVELPKIASEFLRQLPNPTRTVFPKLALELKLLTFPPHGILPSIEKIA